MTVFDERLVELIAEMATDGEVNASAAELANAMDCSDDTIRRSLHRLEGTLRIEVFPNPGGRSVLRLPGGGGGGADPTQQHTTPPTGGCGVAAYAPHTRPSAPPGPKPDPPKSTGPQPRPADRNCPRCEGTGLVFVDLDANVVTDCECRGPDARAWRRARQTANAVRRTQPDGPPAKSDYVEVWRAFARRQLNGDHTEPPDNVRPIHPETLT